MLRLPPLAALVLLLLLLSSVGPTGAEVVKSITDCEGFFLSNVPPEIPGVLVRGNIQDQNRYKTICQTFVNKRRFVTLYDITSKIPVFSAYKYIKDTGGTRPPTNWKMEPQLEDETKDKNMRKDDGSSYSHQASDDDYKNNEAEINRGHLLPSSYGADDEVKNATFTMTNIVPQNKKFNSGTWDKMEKCVKCVMDKHCLAEGYLVVGAKLGNNNLPKGVNIPSRLWSAFCCNTAKGWIASAFWGNNDGIQPDHLPMLTLDQLAENDGPKPFPKSSPGKTVKELYPSSEKECKCI